MTQIGPRVKIEGTKSIVLEKIIVGKVLNQRGYEVRGSGEKQVNARA